MFQIPAHLRKVTLAGLTAVNKASSYLRDILGKKHMGPTRMPTRRAHMSAIFTHFFSLTHIDL